MTVQEVLEQAKTLKFSERKQLLKLLVDTLDAEPEPQAPVQEEKHWGRELNKLLDSLDTTEWQELEIDNLVEALAAIRRQEQARASRRTAEAVG